MLKFRDPQSNIQLAEAELTYKEAVNGEKSLTGTIYSNDEVLHQMERGWSVMLALMSRLWTGFFGTARCRYPEKFSKPGFQPKMA